MLLSRFLSIPLRPDFLFPDRFFYSARTFLVVGGCTSEHSLDRIFYSSARGRFNHIFCRHRNADYHRNADCRRTFCYHADRRRNACRRRSNPCVRSAAAAGGAADTKAEGVFPGWDNKPLSIPQWSHRPRSYRYRTTGYRVHRFSPWTLRIFPAQRLRKFAPTLRQLPCRKFCPAAFRP